MLTRWSGEQTRSRTCVGIVGDWSRDVGVEVDNQLSVDYQVVV